MENFDRIYGETADYFGADMSPLLERHGDRIPAGGRVLDIGIGQGRNALPLARRGLQVTGIDPSAVGLEIVRELAAADGVALDLWRGSFLDYEPDEPFDAVLCFGLLQILDRSQGASLLFRLREWTRPGGLLFLTAWHVDDPWFAEVSTTWEPIGLHSFRSPEGDRRTFLARQEILDLLLGWRIVHHWEGLGPEHSHGGGAVERHGDVEAVAIRLAREPRRRR